MLNVVMLSVVMLSVMAPSRQLMKKLIIDKKGKALINHGRLSKRKGGYVRLSSLLGLYNSCMINNKGAYRKGYDKIDLRLPLNLGSWMK
jgi:hypothetical protein